MRARRGMETDQRNLGAQNNMMQFEMQMAAQQQMMQQKDDAGFANAKHVVKRSE